MSNEELIKKVKEILEKNAIKENDPVELFSNDVISLAYQKISESITDMLKNEEDPIVISEILKSYLEVSDMINNRGIQKQNMLIKLFEQLNKYEQSRYY